MELFGPTIAGMLGDFAPPGVQALEPHRVPLLDGRAGFEVLHLAKAPYRFDAPAKTEQAITLATRINVTHEPELLLVVRLHEQAGWASTASLDLRLFNESVSPVAPEVTFVGKNPIATTTITAAATSTPTLATARALGPADHVRLVLRWSQGTVAGTNQSLILGVSIYGRLHRTPTSALWAQALRNRDVALGQLAALAARRRATNMSPVRDAPPSRSAAPIGGPSQRPLRG